MGVPILISPRCLFELSKKPLGLWVDAKPDLPSGLRLHVHPESVPQGRVDLDGRHSSLLVGTTQEALSILRVNLPETPLPRLILLPRHLDEALVEREVVSDRVLEGGMYILNNSSHTVFIQLRSSDWCCSYLCSAHLKLQPGLTVSLA